MIESKRIDIAVSKMLNWLRTWENNKNAYNGYVVHRGDSKRLTLIHDTPWAQGPIINGLLSLYNITKKKKYLLEASNAVKLQMSRLNEEDSSYIYAGFEDDRFSSLVHNSLANCALLNYAKVIKNNIDKADEYESVISTVKDNIDNYLIKCLWVEKIGAFRFNSIDYYSKDSDRFVANMNSVTIESLIKLYELTGESQYRDIALRTGEWLLTQSITSEEELVNGAISYAQTHKGRVINVYTALALYGVDDLYKLTGDQRYKEFMIKAIEQIMRFTTDNKFCHAYYDNIKKEKPYFLAGSGIILNSILNINNLFDKKYHYEDYLDVILKHQLEIGGISSFEGYHSKGNGRGKHIIEQEVWEDIVPVVGWNAHMFEFLARLVSKEFNEDSKINKTLRIKWNYIYYENFRYFFVFSIWPLKSFELLLIKKNNDKSLISFSLLQVMRYLKGKNDRKI